MEQWNLVCPPDITSSSYSPLVNFSCGVVAGVLASLVTQPADVVKTHIQVSPDHWNTIAAVRHVYKVRPKAFFFLLI